MVLTGPNGAGKTNILEALSLLMPGRGLRRAKLSDIGRDSSDAGGPTPPRSWAVAARVSGVDAPVDVGTGFQASGDSGGERRTIKIDGETESAQAALAAVMSMHWLTPQMDRLFQDGASSRRRFLDRLVFGWDPAHAGRLNAYEQAMRERLKLLREHANPDPAWLTALEDVMAARGIAVAAARTDVISRLAPVAAENWEAFPGAVLALSGTVDGQPWRRKTTSVPPWPRTANGMFSLDAPTPGRIVLILWCITPSRGRPPSVVRLGSKRHYLSPLC